jgi:hypothetical protein
MVVSRLNELGVAIYVIISTYTRDAALLDVYFVDAMFGVPERGHSTCLESDTVSSTCSVLPDMSPSPILTCSYTQSFRHSDHVSKLRQALRG